MRGKMVSIAGATSRQVSGTVKKNQKTIMRLQLDKTCWTVQVKGDLSKLFS